VSLWQLLLPIRREFQQYVNLRPVRLMPGIRSPLADRASADIDFFIVRENTEGEYSSGGGRFNEGADDEYVVQEAIFTRKGCDRVLRYAFELARSRPKRHLTAATKSNGIPISMPYWDERTDAMAARYPEVRADRYHVDILAAHFVQNPDRFDVVVATNLFGDILSDLGPAIAGTIGIAPSANLNPERDYPSMFEPVHGSAPDIAGTGRANPIGQIWSGAMMLEHLGHPDAARDVLSAIESTLTHGPRTADIGGSASTVDVGKAIAEAILR
jgi:tartrate dehydrogenase/decarboxylase / D-malate dehydrogenase